MNGHDFSRSSRGRRCLTLLSGLVLILLVSGCTGEEPRDESEQPRPRTPSTETDARAGEAEEERTTTSAAPTVPEREARPLVWVGVEDADQVALVDIGSGEVLARHRTPGGPHNVTVAEDGTAAAALYASDRLALIDRGNARLLRLGGTPHDAKATGELFAVANEAARRIDLVSRGRHVGSIRLTAEPHDLAIAPGGDRAWVTLNGSSRLAVVDLRARRLVRYVETGRRPHDILFAPDGRVWVTDWAGPVHVFDRGGRLHGRIALARESHHLSFTPDGRQAWITDHSAKRIFIVDARRLERVASLPIRGAPHHVAITPSGGLAAVADHDNGTLAVYDVRRRALMRTVRVGPGPHGVWAVPAGAAG
jgi:DNA-binding beta-propeller fold protein YncE